MMAEVERWKVEGVVRSMFGGAEWDKEGGEWRGGRAVSGQQRTVGWAGLRGQKKISSEGREGQ